MYNQFPDAKILKVNLTSKKIKVDIMPGETYRLYPGGSALGMYLAMQDIKTGIDPLSPENTLVFSVSPLTGLPISGISRMNVTAKSPLTGTIGDTQSGGFFPAHLALNGYDAIVFTGKADKHLYLYIDGENVELRDANQIWGKVTGDAEELIRKELGRDDVEIAQIGPAGENLVKYACIINMCNRANGRNGMGAVMGSKNLKAIVVAKRKAKKAYDVVKFTELSKNAAQRLKENDSVSSIGEFGTDIDIESFSSDGVLVTRNWSSGYFPEGAVSLTGTTMSETILKKRDTCYSCVVRCKRIVEVPGMVDPLYGGPEYETAATFGSYCGVSSLEYVSLANQLCNMYGIDTISCGATIAFAMDCYEKGLIDDKTTEGIKLNFGNEKALPILVEKIAKREGFGDLLAEGSDRAAEIIGEKAVPLVVTVKKQEIAAHMPQAKPAVGLMAAVNPYGADHQACEHDPFLVLPPDSMVRKRLAQIGITKGYEDNITMDDDKVRFALETQKYYSMVDTLSLCQFVWGPCWGLYGPDELVELCKAGIGWDTSIYELMQVGERRINMMRYFNSREGFTKADDVLPPKIFEPLKGGPTEGVVLDKDSHNKAKELYYGLAGWDEEKGNPTNSTMRRLSLQWLLEQ